MPTGSSRASAARRPAIAISKAAKARAAALIWFHRRWQQPRPSKAILQTLESFNEDNLPEETAMKLLFIMLATVFALVACQTMEGFGRDVEKVGGKIEEKAKK